MLDIPVLLILILVISLVFDFTNGANDSGNAIATVVSTKGLSPASAVIMAAVLNLAGAFLGTEVANTIGKGIVHAGMLQGCQTLVLTALLGAIGWNVLSWYLGLPSSSSHALIGGLCGAAVAYAGWHSLNYDVIVLKVLVPLVLSPLGGFIGGYVFMHALRRISRSMHPRSANNAFRKLTIVSAAFMATSHGMNDAQKTMGIMTLALFIFGQIPAMEVPLWVKLACALAISLGTATGGWKIIKTMGHKIFKMEKIHGFAAQTSAGLVISAASHFGAPISTTHVISSAIMGVGSSKRLSAVRWGVAQNMIVAWVLTIPATALFSALIFLILKVSGLV